ncbi:MAG: hypothetical protein AAB444_00455, partial [Patescibacteria group bacterium]
MFVLGKCKGLVRFNKKCIPTISVQGDGGPNYLVVIPDTKETKETKEVVARITEKGVEKVSDGVVLKQETIYFLSGISQNKKGVLHFC